MLLDKSDVVNPLNICTNNIFTLQIIFSDRDKQGGDESNLDFAYVGPITGDEV